LGECAPSLPAPNAVVPHSSPRGIALVGNPNVGKSAIFGALTGRYVTVSNYPGTTVEIARGIAVVSGERVPVLDTPGSNSLHPSSEDERVTRDVLLDGVRAVVAVGDAKNIERTLLLAIQLGETELPLVLCLNMMDEARERSIHVDADALSSLLGIDVVPTVAVRGEGLGRLAGCLRSARPARVRPSYPEPIESGVAALVPLLGEVPIAPRALALMLLAGDPALRSWLGGRLTHDSVERIDAVCAEVRGRLREPVGLVLNRARMSAVWRMAGEIASRGREPERTGGVVTWLDAATTHPLWGPPMLAGVLGLAWLLVGVVGAGTLVDLLEDGLFHRWINPAATAFFDTWVPWTWLRDLFVGPYGLLTMALTYSLALVLPIVGTFFLAFGFLEDSGYLPRLAVLLDRAFKKMGLNGKAVLPMVLGLGCDTMATLTTRILETRKERLIAILLLGLGVPCSAQLAVVLTMLGSLSVTAMLVWLTVVVGVIVLVGALAAKALPGRGSDFVLELPPLRFPRPGNILVKTLARIEWYVKEAVPLFVLGTLVLFVADRLDLLARVERAAEPVVTGLLGLPRETATAFVIGFLRRDFGAAGLYHMAQSGQLDPRQIAVTVVVITLFLPCIANFFMMVKERGWKTGLAIASFVFPFALAVGACLNWLLHVVPVPLR
jgi:ferrous iron transport protein B